ncbi:MAG: DNRLRE domain-containing protein [Ignavibacteriales bacterium]
MLKPKNIFIPFIVLITILMFSCQNEQNPVEPSSSFTVNQLNKVKIPYGATIDSAAFFINVTTTFGAEVTVHRITRYWEEMFVTWNNFVSGFDTNIEGYLTPVTPGWHSVGVTSLVNSWIDQTYPNRGMLLKESSPDTVQFYTSKEEGHGPYLKVWWTLNGAHGYDSTGAIADTYIRSDSGFINSGGALELIAGWQDTTEKQTLVEFEFEIVYTGCTRSYGYWKTHSIYGPAPYDSIWALLGEDSTFFLSNKSYYQVIWTPPSGGNAYYQLAHQYIATKLNFLAGADPSEGQEAFDEATYLFETYTPAYIGSLKGNNPLRQQFIGLKSELAQYNGGATGPGSCSSGGEINQRSY